MDPTLEDKQNDQAREKQSGGGFNQGINAINNLVGFKNPFGKIGSKVAVQAGSKIAAFLFTTPAGWVTIGIVVIVVITLVIVISLGAPPTATDTNATPQQGSQPLRRLLLHPDWHYQMHEGRIIDLSKNPWIKRAVHLERYHFAGRV